MEELKKIFEENDFMDIVTYINSRNIIFVIFWSAPIKNFSRTRWSKVVGSSLYNSITIRNANTVKKILEFVK